MIYNKNIEIKSLAAVYVKENAFIKELGDGLFMRVGIIGCGNIAQVHGWVLKQIENVEIVALTDCIIDKAKEMSDKVTDGTAAVYSDYIEMFAREDLDVVHICTPHYLHVPMAIEALNKNISVFMEKPPAITKEEFDELSRCAEKSKARIGFCFQNRYNATIAELDKIVEQKELGEVIGVRGFVTWRRDKNYYSDDWHGTLAKEGGGVLINQSIHTLDLMLRYLGTPKIVAASMQNHHLQGVIEVEDTLEARLEFEGDKTAVFYATTAYSADAPVILELSFEKGRVTLIDQILQIAQNGAETKVVSCEEKSRNGVGKDYWGRGHLACIEDFYQCLKDGMDYKNDVKGVENTLYTTMRIYEAAGRNQEREG